LSAGNPLLSVIVPTKGRLAYLRSCLHALADADYPRDRFELVVVNDGGGREVDEIAASFGERLDVRVTFPGRPGPSAARNAGAAMARGGFVAFTDDDCEPDPRWLCELERQLERNPGAAVGGKTRNGATCNQPAVASQIVVDAVHAHFNRHPGRPRFFASNNLAFPARPFRALGGFDECFRYAEDRHMCERWIGADHRFVHAPEAVVYHMRTFTLPGFLAQHFGYGRGAFTFRSARLPGPRRAADHTGVLKALALRTMRGHHEGRRMTIAGYVALSQLATAAGFGREALTGLARPGGGGE
jgi:glycosyltransferase involved in cell wall biosynthesis